MSSFEGSYAGLLQGVSQQLPRMRLDGQLSAQVNCISDPVTNPRRRPGAEFRFALDLPGATTNSIRAWEVDLSGDRIHIILEVNTGTVLVLNSEHAVQATLQHDYLIAPSVRAIKAASVSSEMFFVNTGIKPTIVGPAAGVISPDRRGFAYVVAGSFDKVFDVRIETNLGTITASYTTPSGAASGAAAASMPDYIAQQLVASMAALNMPTVTGVSVTRDGPYLYFEGTASVTSLVVSSAAGMTYVVPSNASRIRQEGNLPARLPAAANGYIVGVGQQKLLTYYKYDNPTVSWLETGKYGSPSGIANMPISLRNNPGTSAWELADEPFEGRTAGDDDTNPVPKFVEYGVTGAGSYQGRLVLLAGPQVILSSSKVPRRFMRSTVTGLLDEDPIAVGSSANSSASYEYAVPFQKDLLLFSSKYQALVPGSNVAITPRSATVLVTSMFSGDLNCEPIPIGRTLLYPTPLSSDFFGVLEMIASQYADSQYVSNSATEHLPKYMTGHCRFSAASPVASMVVFGQSRDTHGVIVYQYMWSGDEKVQQAWHRWDFAYPVATAYFSGEAVNFLFVANGKLIGARVDPKIGVLSFESTRRPFLDLYVEVTVTDRKFTVPAWLRDFDPGIGSKLQISQSEGPLAGERVGLESYDPVTGEGTTVRSFRDGVVAIGVPYRSLISPTPPLLKDRNGNTIDTNKLTVLRFGVNTQNSSEFQVAVTDTNALTANYTQGTLRWCSTELSLGQARYAVQGRAVIPARANAPTTSLQLYTEGLGELNVIGLDYTCRYNQKLRRG